MNTEERKQPLVQYVFTNQPDDVIEKELMNKVPSGATLINDCLVHDTNHDLPFGGVGRSGMGRLHGERGFRELSNERAVMNHKLWFDTPDRYPPYDIERTAAIRSLLQGDWYRGLCCKRKDRKKIKNEIFGMKEE